MPNRHTTTLLGIDIDLDSLPDLLDNARSAISRRDTQLCFACANPHSLVVAQSDPDFSTALQDSDIVVADGTGVTLMSRLVHVPIGPRITGEDFFLGIMRIPARPERACACSSSDLPSMCWPDPGTDGAGISRHRRVRNPVAALPRLVTGREPGHAGHHHAARPVCCGFGMTAPKQEKWVYGNRSQLQAPVIVRLAPCSISSPGPSPSARLDVPHGT